MNTTVQHATPARFPFQWMLVAGLVGGLAEVLWVSLYAAFTPADSAVVAREVTETVFGAGAGGAYAPMLGVGLHMLLSIALAAMFTVVVWRWAARAGSAG